MSTLYAIVNGHPYYDTSFLGTAYVGGLPNLMQDFVLQAANIYLDTSASVVALGTGTLTFTTASTAKPYSAGTPLRISDQANPSTRWIDAIVTSYSGNTLTVAAQGFAGTGSPSSWNINLGGSANTVSGSIALAQGGTGGNSVASAQTSLQIVPSTGGTFTGTVTNKNGTAAAPGTVFANDATSGFFSPASGTLAAAVGGAEVIRLNNLGLGIGKTATVALDVNGGGAISGSLAVGGLSVSGAANLNGGVSTTALTSTSVTSANMTASGAVTAANFVGIGVVPSGAVMAFATNTVPTGWLLCDGRAISRTTYAPLFAVISTTFGAGDGTTTFNLPDCRGVTIIGTGTGATLTARSLGTALGEETHTLIIAEMPTHHHPYLDPGHSHNVVCNPFSAGGGSVNIPVPGGANLQEQTTVAQCGITIQDTGGGGAHNNMQPSLVLTYCIKA